MWDIRTYNTYEYEYALRSNVTIDQMLYICK